MATYATDRRYDAPNEVVFWLPPMPRTARSVAQQGLTSCSINVAGRNENLYDVRHRHGGVRSGLEPARLWLFPPTVKDEILRNLRVANITAGSIFPGLDGLGRPIPEIARIGPSLTQTIGGAHIGTRRRMSPPSIEPPVTSPRPDPGAK